MSHPDLATALAMLRAIRRGTGQDTSAEQEQVVREWERTQQIERKAA